MKAAPFKLDESGREIVLKAICEVCRHREWVLLAAHVRTNHVHAVVDGEAKPERILNDFKAYATRALPGAEADRKRWARHGSTRWLWKESEVRAAIRYVVEGQGTPMAVFVAHAV